MPKIIKPVSRMIGGSRNICPPGVFCLTSSSSLLILLGIIIIVGIYLVINKKHVVHNDRPKVIVVEKEPVYNIDTRLNPLPPEKSYFTPPDLFGLPPIQAGLTAIPTNVRTRGIPEQYQQIGTLVGNGGSDMSATPNRTLLPLFGRSTGNGSRWNYYTRSDGLNPVQVPVKFKNKSCDDDNGCDELYDGDSVSAPMLGQSYTVSMYRNSTPRYIPGIL